MRIPFPKWSQGSEIKYLNQGHTASQDVGGIRTQALGLQDLHALLPLSSAPGTYGKHTGFWSFMEKQSIPLIIERFTSMYQNSSSSTW